MTEFSEQCAIIAWARLNERRYPCLRWLHSSLNGVRLTTGLVVKARMAGMTAGVADLFLPYPKNQWHGLYIELKVGKNTTSPAQKEFLEWANAQGYRACVAKGFDEATDIIESYCASSDETRARE